MQVGFEVVAGTRRTAGWLEDIPDERWVYEDEGVGEGSVSAGMEYHPANGYQPDGTFEWEGFSYDNVRTPARGTADSLAEAKRLAEEAVRSGQTALASTAAKPKRSTGDEPVQVPMRPQQQIRQSLSADQKKVRRQMTRKTAAGEPEDHGVCSLCHHSLSDQSDEHCGSSVCLCQGNTTTKESRMSARREAELLQAMAVASLDDQRRIATELAALRAQRTASLQADREVNLADTVVRAHLTPVAPYVPHTASTDWVGEDVPVYTGDPTLEAKSAATIWFNKTSAALREDDEEFALQAQGMALRTAGKYGEAFEHAHRAFMDHVAHLYSKVALTADPSGQGQSTVTDYDTKTDQDPLFAEDFDGEDGTGSQIGSGVHPTPLNLAENTGTGGGTAGDDVDSDSGPKTRAASRRVAKDGDPHGEEQERIDYLETRGDDLSGPDAATIREMDDEEFDRWMDRESKRRAAKRRTAAEGQTCSVCGDAIAKDPSGEDPSTWHHDNGEKHDHEAKPSSKESRRVKTATEDKVFQADNGEWYAVRDGEQSPSFSSKAEAEAYLGKTSSRKTAGEEVRVLSIPMCDVHRFSLGQSNVPAKYDSRLPGLGGSWGNVCEECFQAYGPGTLGTGNAQRLVEGSVKVAEDQRRSADEDDAPVALSDLPQVEVDNQQHPEGAFPWQIGETQGFVSGASLSTDDSLDVVAAFRRTVQANLAARQSR